MIRTKRPASINPAKLGDADTNWEEQDHMPTNPGQRIYDWIMSRLDEGRTVYVSTYLKCWAIKPKHRDMLKVDGTDCWLQHGKRWDSINFCKITAR